jgi:CubicO group peptidase (beta-lactamase class C family)
VVDPHARDVVTARHLLTHTSGFDGDHFTDTGRGDDALARYVAGCSDLPQIVTPGKFWTYSNSSYAILGRIVEVLTGQVFEDVLQQRLFGPLQLQHTVSFAEQAIVHPRSVGHVKDPEQPSRLKVSPTWILYRSFGPMGSAVIASAGDVLRFVRFHLDGGIVPDGASLLDRHLVEDMQEPAVRLVDDTVLGDSWGLGWMVDDWDGVKIIGHDGNSIGQNAFMRVAPSMQFGFCLQTNVESALALYREVAAWLFGKRLGVGPRPDPVLLPDETVQDPARYAGIYEREGLRFEVRADGEGRLYATVLPSGIVTQFEGRPPMEDLPLKPVTRKDSFTLRLPIADADLLAVFFDPDGGGLPTYMHFGARAARRLL